MSQQNLSSDSEEPLHERVENHDLGAGPVHIAWIFKPGSESTPDKSILQLQKYVTAVTPSTLASKSGIKGAGSLKAHRLERWYKNWHKL